MVRRTDLMDEVWDPNWFGADEDARRARELAPQEARRRFGVSPVHPHRPRRRVPVLLARRAVRVTLRSRLILAAAYLLTVVVIALEAPLAVNIDHDDFRLTSAVLSNAAIISARISDDLAAQEASAGVAATQPTPAMSSVAAAGAARLTARVVVADQLGQVVTTRPNEAPPGTLYMTSERPEFAAAILGGRITTLQRFSETLGQDLRPRPCRSSTTGNRSARCGSPSRSRRSDPACIEAGSGSRRSAWRSPRRAGLAAALGDRPPRGPARGDRGGPRPGSPRRAGGPAGPKEVARLSASFNQMAGTMGANVDAQRDFVANASHQLRTPMTGVRLRLEAIEQAGGDTAADASKAAVEVDRLTRLVNDVLAGPRKGLERPDRDLAEIQARARGLDARGPCEVQQVVDETGQTVDLDRCLGGVGRRVSAGLLDRLQAQTKPGERRAELVRGVRHEVALGGHVCADRPRHLVERPGERRHLARPGGIRPRAEVSPPQANSGLLEPAHRARESRSRGARRAPGRRARPPGRSARARASFDARGIGSPRATREIRTAPIDCPLWTTGTVTSRRSWPSVSLNRCSVVIRPPRIAAASSGRSLVMYNVPGGACWPCRSPPDQAGRPPRPWP